MSSVNPLKVAFLEDHPLALLDIVTSVPVYKKYTIVSQLLYGDGIPIHMYVYEYQRCSFIAFWKLVLFWNISTNLLLGM